MWRSPWLKDRASFLLKPLQSLFSKSGFVFQSELDVSALHRGTDILRGFQELAAEAQGGLNRGYMTCPLLNRRKTRGGVHRISGIDWLPQGVRVGGVRAQVCLHTHSKMRKF